MKLHIVTVGQRPPAWVRDGFEEYARRMPRELPIVLSEIRPASRPGATSPVQIDRARITERERLLAALPSGSVKVALDERGRMIATVELAARLEKWMGQGRDIGFLIGGPDGLDDEIRKNADMVLSLSKLTMPHALVRVVLAEQLYRAVSVIRNHPYHRE